MTITVRRGGRDLATSLVGHLDDWTGAAPFTDQLHSGDVGWHLRFDDARLSDAFLVWEDDGRPVAVGLGEDAVLRTALDPSRDRDPALAEALASEMTAFRWVDALGGTATRRLLLERGWSVDPDPWVTLQRAVGRDDALPLPDDVRPVDGPAVVAARVAVQRSAFSPGSTFTSELWERMTGGPTYDPRFDLVVWTPSGEPAAAATGWFAGVGRCAILEPVGTHQDHQRQGYGRRVSLAVMAALAGAGAGAVRVSTPASNRAAVATYEACGLRHVDCTTAMTSP